MNNDKKAFKSGFWYTISSFLTQGIGFITTPIFTRLLTQSDFGLYSNYTAFQAVIVVFISMQLEASMIRAQFDYKDRLDEYILSILSLSFLAGFGWLLILCFAGDYISNVTGVGKTYLFIMAVYMICIQVVNLFQVKERYRFNYKVSIALSLFLAVGSSVLSVLLVLFFENKLAGRIIGAALPAILIGLIILCYFIKKGKRIKICYWRYAVPICLPSIPHVLSLNMLNSFDRIMITNIVGASANALYSIAYSCGSIITILISSLNSAFAPWIGEKLHQNNYKQIYRTSRIYILFFSAMMCIILLISPEILTIMGGEKYRSAIYVMPPVAAGCFCQFIYSMFVNVEQYKRKTIGMACASVMAASLNYLLNLLFIPRFGYIAAAYTTLLGYLFLQIAHMILVYRMQGTDIYDYKFIFLVTVVMIMLTVIVNFLMNYLLIRYLIVFVITIMCGLFLFRRKENIHGIR